MPCDDHESAELLDATNQINIIKEENFETDNSIGQASSAYKYKNVLRLILNYFMGLQVQPLMPRRRKVSFLALVNQIASMFRVVRQSVQVLLCQQNRWVYITQIAYKEKLS